MKIKQQNKRPAYYSRNSYNKIQEILKAKGIERGDIEIPKWARISKRVPQFPRDILFEHFLSQPTQARILKLDPKPSEHHIRFALFLHHWLTELEAYRAIYPDQHLAYTMHQELVEEYEKKPSKDPEIRKQELEEKASFKLETARHKMKSQGTARSSQVRNTLAILRQEEDLQLLDTTNPTPKKLVARLNSIAEKLAERPRITQADAETLKNLYHEIILLQQLPSYDRDVIEVEQAPEELSYEDLVLKLSSDAWQG